MELLLIFSTKNPNFRGIYPAAAESPGRRLRRVPCRRAARAPGPALCMTLTLWYSS